MPSTSVVIDIFANDLPVFKVESFFAKNFIGLKKAVKYESMRVAQLGCT